MTEVEDYIIIDVPKLTEADYDNFIIKVGKTTEGGTTYQIKWVDPKTKKEMDSIYIFLITYVQH